LRSLDALTGGSTVDDAGLSGDADASADAGFAGALDAGDDAGAEAGTSGPPECDGAATTCASARAQRRCVGGRWSEPEACEHACIADACAGECDPGDRACDGAQRIRCDDHGAWIADGEPCANVCEDGACAGTCVPDTTQCISSTQVQTCAEDGRWGDVSTCTFACVGDACGGGCVPGTRECVAETPQRAYIACSTEGAWSAAVLCSYVCEGAGECGGECVPGARGCFGNVPLGCSDEGTLIIEAACGGETPVCVADGRCRCKPGATRCGGGAGQQPQVCNAIHQWVDVGASCANCSQGQCLGEGCTAERIAQCESVGCHCATGDCSGGYCEVGDGCTGARRAACADLGCGCVDGKCSGGMCEGSGCTASEHQECSEGGCNCALHSCAGGSCTD